MSFWCWTISFFVFVALTCNKFYYVSGHKSALIPPNGQVLSTDSSLNNTNTYFEEQSTTVDQQNRPIPTVRQLRKQLRSKQRRLRKLTNEIQNLKAKLKPEVRGAVGKTGEIITNNNNNNNGEIRSNVTVKRKLSKASWRRRVMTELKRLNEQIRILSLYKLNSNQTTTSSADNRSVKRRKGRKNRIKNGNGDEGETNRPVDVVTSYPPDSSTKQMEDQAKIRLQIRRMRNKRKRLKKIKSMWENGPLRGSTNKTRIFTNFDVAKGEPGYQCKAHKECRPGCVLRKFFLLLARSN